MEKIKVSLADTKWLKCGKGSYTTSSATLFKKVSAIMSPSGTEELMPIRLELCTTCGKVPPFLLEMLAPDLVADLPADLLPSEECRKDDTVTSPLIQTVSGI